MPAQLLAFRLPSSRMFMFRYRNQTSLSCNRRCRCSSFASFLARWSSTICPTRITDRIVSSFVEIHHLLVAFEGSSLWWFACCQDQLELVVAVLVDCLLDCFASFVFRTLHLSQEGAMLFSWRFPVEFPVDSISEAPAGLAALLYYYRLRRIGCRSGLAGWFAGWGLAAGCSGSDGGFDLQTWTMRTQEGSKGFGKLRGSSGISSPFDWCGGSDLESGSGDCSISYLGSHTLCYGHCWPACSGSS